MTKGYGRNCLRPSLRELATIFCDNGPGGSTVGVGDGWGLFADSTTIAGSVGEPRGVVLAGGVGEPDGSVEFARFRLLLAISESLKKLNAATLIDRAAAQQAIISILLEIPDACRTFSPHRVQKVDSSGIFIPHFEQNTAENPFTFVIYHLSFVIAVTRRASEERMTNDR
jgi:hypothetical protein